MSVDFILKVIRFFVSLLERAANTHSDNAKFYEQAALNAVKYKLFHEDKAEHAARVASKVKDLIS